MTTSSSAPSRTNQFDLEKDLAELLELRARVAKAERRLAISQFEQKSLSSRHAKVRVLLADVRQGRAGRS